MGGTKGGTPIEAHEGILTFISWYISTLSSSISSFVGQNFIRLSIWSASRTESSRVSNVLCKNIHEGNHEDSVEISFTMDFVMESSIKSVQTQRYPFHG